MNNEVTLTHGSLFSGIGGFDLAASWVGFKNIFQVEIDKYCLKTLNKNFPNVTKYEDIREFSGKKYNGTIDIVSGGFPCQPFSVSGLRKGTEDNRYLWKEMLRVIREIQPIAILGENVPGIIGMELDNVQADMESAGYKTQTFIIPACSVGAWHKRDRVWIVCYSKCFRQRRFNWGGAEKESTNRCEIFSNANGSWQLQQKRIEQTCGERISNSSKITSNNVSKRFKKQQQCKLKKEKYETPLYNSWWEFEPGLGRVANGIPNRVDRLKGLGNAIVPQVAYKLFSAIKQQIIYGEYE